MKTLCTLCIFLFLLACSQPASETISDLLAPADFADKLKSNGDAVLLDVRSTQEMQQGFIEGAQQLDYNGPGFKNLIASLDKSKTYFVYCASGKRSGKTLEMMKGMGFKNVAAMDGGLNAWTAAGLPLAKP